MWVPLEVQRYASIRPERIELGSGSQSFHNQFEGIVREIIYLGDQIRIHLTIGGADNFILKMPNSHHVSEIAVGQAVKVGWRAQDCRALATGN